MSAPPSPLPRGEAARRAGEGSSRPRGACRASPEPPLTPALCPGEKEIGRLAPDPLPLIIGVGNPLRGDDGAGWRAAAALERRWGGRVRVLRGHQVVPEWAPELAEAGVVYFVDASTSVESQREDGGAGATRGPTIEALAPAPRIDAASGSHGLDPAALLRLTLDLYGCAPKAYLVSIPGTSFGYGEGLSRKTDCALRVAVAELDVALAARLAGVA